MDRMKFRRNQKVRFKEDSVIYIVIHGYKTEEGYKYDLLSYDGKVRIHSITEDCLDSAT